MVRGFRTFFGFPFTIRISGSRSSLSATKMNGEYPPSNRLKVQSQSLEEAFTTSARTDWPGHRTLQGTGETWAREKEEVGSKAMRYSQRANWPNSPQALSPRAWRDRNCDSRAAGDWAEFRNKRWTECKTRAPDSRTPRLSGPSLWPGRLGHPRG